MHMPGHGAHPVLGKRSKVQTLTSQPEAADAAVGFWPSALASLSTGFIMA